MRTVLIVGGLVALGAALWWFVRRPNLTQIPTNGNTLGSVLGWDGLFHTDPYFGPEVG